MPRIALGSYSIAQLESIIQSRRSRVSSLERDREKLHRQLAALDERIVGLGGSTSAHAPVLPDKSRRGRPRKIHSVINVVSGIAGPVHRGGGRPKNPKSLAETIFSVLSKHGPSSITEIIKAVQETGYKSKSPAFRNIVNQQLIKDDRFAAASRGVYQIKR